MLGNSGPTGATNTLPGLTINRERTAIMAKALDATNSPNLKPRSGVEALMRRFYAKIDTSPGFGPDGDCHRWTGRINGRGYGEIKIGGQYKRAHRLALFGFDGINDPRMACHRCDNPGCVRESHIFAGEAIDNVRDMHRKGRSHFGGNGGLPGRPHPHRKLKPEQVREIRATGISRRVGAVKYGVSPFTIDGIKRGTLYKDVA